jgi:hypothetical protein
MVMMIWQTWDGVVGSKLQLGVLSGNFLRCFSFFFKSQMFFVTNLLVMEMVMVML